MDGRHYTVNQWNGILRKMAREALFRQYAPRTPCSKGHFSYRWVSTNGCVECSDRRKKDWVKANPERARVYGQRHYQENSDGYKARAAAARKANPERDKLYRKRAKKQAPELRRESERARRSANPAKYRARARIKAHRRRVKCDDHFTQADIDFLFKKQKGKCVYCPSILEDGNREIDHIIPVAKGGTNSRRNIQLLCLSCNRSKSAKHPVDFAQERGLLL